jgi:rod shape-determining protein MreD
MQLHNRSEQILRPAQMFYVWTSLFIALVLNFLPTRELIGMPDWVALVLSIWAVREFRLVGMSWAFVLGILMDVADAAVLGQHALAYVILAFGASGLSRRVQWFPLTHQGLHVLPLLMLVPVIQAVVRFMAGDDFPDWTYFISPIVSALLWAPMTILMLLPQLRPHERDETRPI